SRAPGRSTPAPAAANTGRSGSAGRSPPPPRDRPTRSEPTRRESTVDDRRWRLDEPPSSTFYRLPSAALPTDAVRLAKRSRRRRGRLRRQRLLARRAVTPEHLLQV